MGSMIENQDNAVVMHWCGYHRPSRRKRWDLVCVDDTESECYRRLHEQRRGGDFLIRCPGSQNPNDDKRPR